jgi:hypothetical protein
MCQVTARRQSCPHPFIVHARNMPPSQQSSHSDILELIFEDGKERVGYSHDRFDGHASNEH